MQILNFFISFGLYYKTIFLSFKTIVLIAYRNSPTDIRV